MNILLSGCNGAMGQTIETVLSSLEGMDIVAGFDTKSANHQRFPVYQTLENVSENIDVIIDFSHFSAFDAITDFAFQHQIPIVVATTGLSLENEEKLIKMSSEIPVFRTANMSIGINVMLGLVAQAEKMLQGFDIEILERHHNKKQDAPSGTALMLADAINQATDLPYEFVYGREGKSAKRKEREIGIHAIRGGTIAGEHTVLYAGDDEIIEITHSATSKKVFAKGAVTAARYIHERSPGMYDMKKLLGLT
ncbi:4-hydroxy-tetrahydrodipicolinate reductase [Alkalibacter rhizosphaerae]|uniref:4-hydroxy-tetrahydrodipicolinate reductase n=1 Tax=Alkalibacter rhizosphaerae TaxID=2815577 RepID=A0A974XEW9_9FIRM|nr:4-hydroxy-tetrahydrodipicolinate reductase [Alkalibacter rhizosphaerae]QSX08486.1 4-hydroxy-tetrahydrodipicolinate reductase [Alkalibacter rhizosphaerae]